MSVTKGLARSAVKQRIEATSGVPPFSREILGVRLRLLQLERAPRVALGPGELLGKGCELVFSSICWSAGNPVPLSALVDASVVLGEMPDGDVLSFELAGKQLPSEHKFTTTLTTLFPLPEYQGQPVQQQVWLKSAQRVELAPQVNLDDATLSLNNALQKERAQAVEARASEAVLTTLGVRLGLVPAEEMVHARALEMWATIDQPRLQALGLDEPTLRRARGAWLASKGITDWASRQLQASAVLKALFETEVLDEKLAASEAEATLKALGVTAEQLGKATPGQAEQVYSHAVVIAARRQLMQLHCVTITDR